MTNACRLALASFVVMSACGGSSPTAPTAPPSPKVATNTGTISGGGAGGRCGALALSCLAFGPYVAREGNITVRVSWTDENTILFAELVDADRRSLVLSSRDPSNRLAHSLTAAVPAGSYYVHVMYVLGSDITPFELIVNWMG